MGCIHYHASSTSASFVYIDWYEKRHDVCFFSWQLRFACLRFCMLVRYVAFSSKFGFRFFICLSLDESACSFIYISSRSAHQEDWCAYCQSDLSPHSHKFCQFPSLKVPFVCYHSFAAFHSFLHVSLSRAMIGLAWCFCVVCRFLVLSNTY